MVNSLREIVGSMSKRFRTLMLLSAAAMLAACRSDLLHPLGDVAAQQRDMLIRSTVLMLFIIVPVMVLTVVFAWRYRHTNRTARYEPEWDHSTQLELVIWSAPLLIIICLGALTWLGTHLLDPYRPIDRLAPDRAVVDTEPLQVDVVALDWKWLFIYPKYGVATVNELTLPVNRPVALHITASSVMNSLYIPALAGQVYAMPGMETQLHGVLNKTGESQGFSANYSGAGFSGMRLNLRSVSAADFDAWLSNTRSGSEALTRDRYLQLALPSESEPVRYFAGVEASLFHAILNRCVVPGKMCMDDMMSIDAKGGLGLAGIYNVAPLTRDKFPRFMAADPRKSYVAGTCSSDDNAQVNIAAPSIAIDDAPLLGAGLSPPGQAGRKAFRYRAALL